jgi:hypothetical protein
MKILLCRLCDAQNFEVASTSLENLWIPVSKTEINRRMALGVEFQLLPMTEEFLMYSAFASLCSLTPMACRRDMEGLIILQLTS